MTHEQASEILKDNLALLQIIRDLRDGAKVTEEQQAAIHAVTERVVKQIDLFDAATDDPCGMSNPAIGYF